MKRILSLTLTLMLLISGLCCAMAESVTLDAWQNEAGWTSFAFLAQDVTVETFQCRFAQSTSHHTVSTDT